MEKLPDYIRALMKPSSYGHPAAEVELIQTHISYVLIAGEFVYKFKKPMDFGFLDFSTLDKRAHYCLQEITLNRRLCPEIYLEKSFKGTELKPREQLTVARELGETSLMFPVHPMLTDDEVLEMGETLAAVLRQATR